MKYLLVLVILLISTICNAQIIEKSSTGDYRLSPNKVVWEETSIQAKGEAKDFSAFFKQAINNPDKPITVYSHEQLIKPKLGFKKIVNVHTKTITYNSSTKIITYKKSNEKKEKDSLIILYILGLIVLMIISNVLYEKNEKSLPSFILNAIAVFAIVLATVPFILSRLEVIVLIICTLLISIVIIVSSHFKKEALYRVSSVLYYAFIIATTLVLYI